MLSCGPSGRGRHAGVSFGRMVQFLLPTACRRTEVAGMMRAERQGAEWTVPAERHKSKKDFLVPLSGHEAQNRQVTCLPEGASTGSKWSDVISLMISDCRGDSVLPALAVCACVQT